MLGVLWGLVGNTLALYLGPVKGSWSHYIVFMGANALCWESCGGWLGTLWHYIWALLRGILVTLSRIHGSKFDLHGNTQTQDFTRLWFLDPVNPTRTCTFDMGKA